MISLAIFHSKELYLQISIVSSQLEGFSISLCSFLHKVLNTVFSKKLYSSMKSLKIFLFNFKFQNL